MLTEQYSEPRSLSQQATAFRISTSVLQVFQRLPSYIFHPSLHLHLRNHMSTMTRPATCTGDEALAGIKPTANHHLDRGFPPCGFLTRVGQSSFVWNSSMWCLTVPVKKRLLGLLSINALGSQWSQNNTNLSSAVGDNTKLDCLGYNYKSQQHWSRPMHCNVDLQSAISPIGVKGQGWRFARTQGKSQRSVLW